MKKTPLLITVIVPFLLSGCALLSPDWINNLFPDKGTSDSSSSDSESQSSQSSSSTTNSTSGTASDSSSSSSTSSSSSSTSGTTSSSSTSSSSSSSTSEGDEEEIDDSKVESIKLDKNELEVKVGNRSSSLIVTFTPDDLDLEYKEVSWSSLDESIATVDEYGRVTGVSKGQTVVTCTSLEGSRKARCTVYVVDSTSVITKKWLRVSDPSEFKPGDIVAIACPESGVSASAEHTGMYLHPVESTFSSDGNEITSLNSLSDTYMLDKDEDGWTLEGEEGNYLATTHTGKVTYIYKTGNVHWDMEAVPGFACIDLRSSSNIDGWFMYNAKAEKFTTYTSNAQIDMFVISLYRQTRIYNS